MGVKVEITGSFGFEVITEEAHTGRDLIILDVAYVRVQAPMLLRHRLEYVT